MRYEKDINRFFAKMIIIGIVVIVVFTTVVFLHNLVVEVGVEKRQTLEVLKEMKYEALADYFDTDKETLLIQRSFWHGADYVLFQGETYYIEFKKENDKDVLKRVVRKDY
jgi:hypothetical protein